MTGSRLLLLLVLIESSYSWTVAGPTQRIAVQPNNNHHDESRVFLLMSPRDYGKGTALMSPTELLTSKDIGDGQRSLLLPRDVESTPIEDDVDYKRNRTVTLTLLWLATLSALDRVAMSVALVPMAEEFAFTDSIKGSISSLFSVGYGLCILPVGLLVASASPRIVMTFGLALWSIATIATPLSTTIANSMVPLLAARACVGAAESVLLPTMQRFLAAWTRPDEKSTAFAIIQSGFQTGTIAAYLLSPIVVDYFGSWREIFYMYGAVGVLFIVPWLAFAKDKPAQQIAVPTSPVMVADSDFKWESSLREAPWIGFLQSPGCWGMLLAHAAKNWGLYNTLAWTPTFYYEQYGLSVRDSALLSVLPSISGAVGGLVAGNLADAVIRRLDKPSDEDLTKVRKVFQSIASVGPALALGTLAYNIPEDPQTAVCFLVASVGLQSFIAAGFEAGNQEKAGEKWAGLLYSVTTLPAVCLGTFGVWFVGELLDATGQNWSVVFALNSAINLAGAAAFVALYNSKKEFD